MGRICPTFAPRSEPGADVVCAKKRVKGEAKKKKKPSSLGNALARRTHQLLVLQLRPVAPQHRPLQPCCSGDHEAAAGSVDELAAALAATKTSEHAEQAIV
jgi:hypothetical protein